MLLLGLGALLIGLTLDLCYALAADALGRRFRSVRTTSPWRNRIVAAVYLTLAAAAVLTV
jgi:threonine/homoserine/homoserine lactone efflux protein